MIEDSITEALKAAALAGIDVSLMVARREPDHRLVHWAANTYFADGGRIGESPTMGSGDWRKFVPGAEPGRPVTSPHNPVLDRPGGAPAPAGAETAPTS